MWGNRVKSTFLAIYVTIFFKFNVATEYHLGLLKAKLAKYRSQLLEPAKGAGAKVQGVTPLFQL